MKKSLDRPELTVDILTGDNNSLHIANISRRTFLKDLALTGFVLAAGFPSMTRSDETAAPVQKDKYAPMPCLTVG